MVSFKSFIQISFCLVTSLVQALPIDPQTKIPTRASSGSKAVGYFVNWGIYARNYQPAQLPASELTHVLYAFANVDGQSGAVELSDTYADLQKHYPNDSWNEQGNNVYGCVKQLFLLKKANRNMKTLLSIGGWTYSPNFPAPLSTASGQSTFVSSAVKMVSDLGFDGVDIDYEYPNNTQQANDFVSTLQQLRTALDTYAAGVNLPKGTFLISVASPAGPTHYEAENLSGMDKYVDMWNLMAYDYAGSWSNVTGHDANINPSTSDPDATPFNTQQALNYYTSHGVAASKINLGIPLYGRSFASTAGMGQPFSGVGQGSWEAGVYDWKAIPVGAAVSQDDNTVVGSWTYDSSSKELVSYDSMAVMKTKATKAATTGLGGLMWWEMSADRNGSDSAVSAQISILSQHSPMEQRQNVLSYPNSQYDNLRAGFPSG